MTSDNFLKNTSLNGGKSDLLKSKSHCFEQKYEKISEVLSQNFHFLVVKFSIYLNRRVFVMEI